MRRLVKKQIMMMSFCVMQMCAMDSIIEVHPFMHSGIHVSLQAIKDKQIYGLFRDKEACEVQAARKVFIDNMNGDSWIHGKWDDGSRWKMSARCGVGLLELLSGNQDKAKDLIVNAMREDKSAWAHYYVGIFVLIAGKMENPIPTAFKYFQQAHQDNPDHIPSHWYRHIMAMAGWNAEQKNNWMIWLDTLLCKNYKIRLSYPLALYGRKYNDQVGAEMLCLEVAARYPNEYQRNAINDLQTYCLKGNDSTGHPYAHQADALLREIASKRSGYLARIAVGKLDMLKYDHPQFSLSDSNDDKT
jgi:hypothetical protein